MYHIRGVGEANGYPGPSVPLKVNIQVIRVASVDIYASKDVTFRCIAVWRAAEGQVVILRCKILESETFNTITKAL